MAMTRFDTENFGIVEGRLVRDAKIVAHKDGSKTALVTVAVDRDYEDRQGNRQTDFIDFQGFIRNGKSDGVYAYMKKGNQVKIVYTTQSYQRRVSAKEFVAELKKNGVKSQEEAAMVQKTIMSLGLAQFDQNHDMVRYETSRVINGVTLMRSSKSNFEASQSTSQSATQTAPVETTQAAEKPAPAETAAAEDETVELTDDDLPF